jgi:hypothetical protein
VKSHQRLLLRAIEARGHTVLALVHGRKHAKVTVRLSDGREVKLPIPGSPSCGERIARDLLMMLLRRAEKGVVDGRRDRD